MLWIVLIIPLAIIIYCIIKLDFARKNENLIQKNRSNLMVGNKCNIIHPQNSNKTISVKITRIEGDIIYVTGKYASSNTSVYSFYDMPIPKNEIFPYE